MFLLWRYEGNIGIILNWQLLRLEASNDNEIPPFPVYPTPPPRLLWVQHRGHQSDLKQSKKTPFSLIIIYMKNSDWLRAVHCFFTVQKRVNSVQKQITNQAFWLVSDQRNSHIANQIFSFQIKRTPWMAQFFSWLRNTRAFPLLNHLAIFSRILLISNHKIFLVQFGINKHL